MVVGVCRLTLMMPGSHSLKEKRAVIRRIKDRTRHKFNVAVAEVDAVDSWQQGILGFAIVANDRAFVESVLRRIVGFVDDMGVAKIVDDEVDFVVYGDDEELSQDGPFEHWEPVEPSPGRSRRREKGRG